MHVYRLNYHFYDHKCLFMKNVASILVNTYYTISSRQARRRLEEEENLLRYNYKNFIRFFAGVLVKSFFLFSAFSGFHVRFYEP